MADLSGEHRCTMDDKGRLNFPSRLRELVGETFVVARWLDGCLAVFTQDEWAKQTSRIEGQGLIKYRNLRRMLYGGKIDVTPDKQGRILISPELRKYAKLEKEIVVTGVGSYIEIWNAAAWDEQAENIFSNENLALMEELDF